MLFLLISTSAGTEWIKTNIPALGASDQVCAQNVLVPAACGKRNEFKKVLTLFRRRQP